MPRPTARTRLGLKDRVKQPLRPYRELDDVDPLTGLADWSAWPPFEDAVAAAPNTPGVYLARESASRSIVYVGMAGERRGRGIRGRLSVYRSGKAAVSGLGEAAMDRALADPEWIRARLAELDSTGPVRIRIWAAKALEDASVENQSCVDS